MDIQQTIHEMVHSQPVVLFMKGTPDMPQCGFSAKVAAVLRLLGCEYSAVNVLDDQDIREGIKVFGQWPTIPQLYVRGELIGGCDIVLEMYESGELATLLRQ